MLHILLSEDWTEGRDEILRRISMDVHQKQGNRVLMVPELISHDTERRLCVAAGDTASRYAEVLSFTRLARRVADSAGTLGLDCLDEGGRVVAMAAAARQLSSRLKAYAAVETRPEFLTGLIDAVDEFKRCCISSQDLKAAALTAGGSLAQKLDELSLLMESYDALCARGRRDPRDQMTWCLEQMEESGYARGRVFYIDGFPDFTRQHMAILEHLIREAADVTVSLNCDSVDSSLLAFEKAGDTAGQLLRCAAKAGVAYQVEQLAQQPDPLTEVRRRLFQGGISGDPLPAGALRVCRAGSAWQELELAAARVQELVLAGCRYRDITLVCTDMAVYEAAADMVFSRAGIPLYRSGTEDILRKSVITTVLNALDAALGNFEQKSVLRYLRSALSPLDPDTCDQVENYAVIWAVRGKKWTQPWENHPDGLSAVWDDTAYGTLSMLNRARAWAVEPLVRLRRGFREGRVLRDQVTALYGFLEDIRLDERLAILAGEYDDGGDNRSAQILNQLWEILLSALDQLYSVLGDTAWEPEHFVRLLRLLLSQYDVGTIPPVLDAVQLGPVSAMRCHQEKHLILLGAEEGKLPGYSGSAGVLTDQERVTLREMGVPLTGGAMEGIQAEFAEIYGVFCGARESVWVSCASEQPSFVFRRLAQMTECTDAEPPQTLYARTGQGEAAAYLSGFHARDAALDLGLEAEYARACRRRDHGLGNVSRPRIDALYGKQLNLSASQIDRQAECRFSYFLKYGLRARERKEATVDPAEFGTYVHAVLENTARCIRDLGGFHQISLEETLEIAHRFSEEYAREHFAQLDSQRLAYLFRRNAQELDMVVRELWEELRQSLFAPAAFEVNFGSAEGLPPIAIPNGSMEAILRGFIDRMDTWTAGGTTYYRVVDYKTGRKDFDYCDVFNGVGLQMLLYMFALRHSGEENLGERPVPAGVQYFPARAPYMTADGSLEDAAAEKQREKEWKRRGLLLKDGQVLQAMEPGDKPQRMDYSVKKDGTLSGDLADRDQMRLLEGYIFRYLGSMVEDIASGNVQPNPYTRGSRHDACAFCPYGMVCHKDTVKERRNYQTMSAQRFWEEVEKEMRKHGG